jgi:hypothetical protein
MRVIQLMEGVNSRVLGRFELTIADGEPQSIHSGTFCIDTVYEHFQ